MIELIIRFLIGMGIVYLSGELFKKINLPSVIGWLLSGMILGPYVLNIVTNNVLSQDFYKITINYAQVFVGVIIGSNLVISKLKRSGKKLIVISLSEIIFTFTTVFIAFAILYKAIGFPWYLCVIIASIAVIVSTAPVNQVISDFKVDGSLGRTVLPILSMNNLIAIICFFAIISFIEQQVPGNNVGFLMNLFLKLALPVILGLAIGGLAVFLNKKREDLKANRISFWISLFASLIVGLVINRVIVGRPIINFILLGVGLSLSFANLLSEEAETALFKSLAQAKTFGLLLIFINNSVPIDITKIFSAGGFAILYVVARATGKMIGSYIGGLLSHSNKSIKNYLGFALLPHAGFSLIFTGAALAVLRPIAPQLADMLVLTIPGAAIVNEFISIMLSKKAYEWTKEVGMAGKYVGVEQIPIKTFPTIPRVPKDERKGKVCYFVVEDGEYSEICS